MRTSLTFRVNSWESIPSHILSDNVFTNEEVDKITSYCQENGKFGSGTIGSLDEKNTLNKDIRDSKIKFFYFNDETSWIFKKLRSSIEKVNEDFYNFRLVGFDKFQYSEYNHEGSKYDAHIDCFLGKKDSNLMRKMSVSMLLSDPDKDFEGGKFEISTGIFSELKQKKGTVIFFPSFIMHRVTPVVKGNRKSIVVWVLGPKFK